MITRTFAAVLAALLFSLAAPTLAPTVAAAQPGDRMSEQRAGSYYLKGACRAAKAHDRFAEKIWRGRRTISTPEVKRRLPELRRLSSAYSDSLYAWARHLKNPPAAWPSSVSSAVGKLANRNLTASSIRARQGVADTARAWLNANGRANRVSYGNFARSIRATLDLPPPGRGC